jgi:hypothetical protein
MIYSVYDGGPKWQAGRVKRITSAAVEVIYARILNVL